MQIIKNTAKIVLQRESIYVCPIQIPNIKSKGIILCLVCFDAVYLFFPKFIWSRSLKLTYESFAAFAWKHIVYTDLLIVFFNGK